MTKAYGPCDVAVTNRSQGYSATVKNLGTIELDGGYWIVTMKHDDRAQPGDQLEAEFPDKTLIRFKVKLLRNLKDETEIVISNEAR